jgi:hypothetical protein
MPSTVTFDTNALASVVAPETAQRDTGISGAAVRAAIQAGHIQGFFSETLITLEGIENKDRAELLGKTQVVSDISASDGDSITIAVGVQHFRRPLNPRFAARIEGARARSACAL